MDERRCNPWLFLLTTLAVRLVPYILVALGTAAVAFAILALVLIRCAAF